MPVNIFSTVAKPLLFLVLVTGISPVLWAIKKKKKGREREKRELSTSKHNYFECNRPDNFLSASYLLICNISVPPFPISYTCKKSNISQMS